MSVIGPTRDICVVDAEKYHDKAAGTGAPQRQFSVKNVILSHIPMSEDIVTEVLRVAEARTMSQHQPGMRTQHGNMIGYGAGVGRAGAARARFGRLALAISRQPKCECSVTIARLDAVQQPYNLFEREIEADVLPYAARAGLAILSYGALCRGLLSGRMAADTKFDGDDLRKVDPKFQGKRFRQYLTAVDELKRIAHERSVNRSWRLLCVGYLTKARRSLCGVLAILAS